MRLKSEISRRIGLGIIAPTCLLLSGGCGAAVGQGLSTPLYRIKPPEITLPPDVNPGQYRRITQPFQNWVLICDENLRAKKRVCNISQQIVDQYNEVAFSWSLAGTEAGKPVMILRTPASVGVGNAIRLSFRGKDKPIDVTISACDMKVCVAMLPVGPRMKSYIRSGASLEVSYARIGAAEKPEKIVIDTTLNGLSTALGAV